MKLQKALKREKRQKNRKPSSHWSYSKEEEISVDTTLKRKRKEKLQRQMEEKE